MQSALFAGATLHALSASADDPDGRAAVTYPPVPADVAPAAAAGRPPPALGGRRTLVLDLAGGEGGLGGLGAAPFGAFVGPVSFSSNRSEQPTRDQVTESSSTRFAIAPSVDLFVTERLSIGGRVSVAWGSASMKSTLLPAGSALEETIKSTDVGVAPRIGYAFPISSSFAFWPRLTIGAEYLQTRRNGASAREIWTGVAEASFGVVARLAPHLFLDVGPTVGVRAYAGLDTTEGTSVNMGARGALRLDF